MNRAERFEKNLERWVFFWPKQVETLKEHAQKEVSSISQSQISQETMRKWASSLRLGAASVLYVYGLDLGFTYDVIKPWLDEDRDRYLIILEEDPQVLAEFMHTENAEKLLNNWQVRICLCDTPANEESVFSRLIEHFPLRKWQMAATPAYEQAHPNAVEQKKASLYYLDKMKSGVMTEFIQGGRAFYQNFYGNMFHLPEAYCIPPMKGQFTGVPAIICGAGPSLDKNADVLKTLNDKALIFGGGTSMNALNAKGILPHFGVGIDPNWIQYTRLIANTGFAVPYFYRARMNYQALDIIHGSKVYVPGAGGHAVVDWFDEQLGLEKVKLYEGFNVVSFSMSIAYFLGCHPIIFVGLDLAYEGENSYASGIESHALHIRRKDFRTKGVDDELLVKEDVNGNPVFTQWRWLAESSWYAYFKKLHPDVKLVNATEGGIGLAGLPHMPLEEAASQFCGVSRDVSGLVHTEMQNSPMPDSVNEERIESVMKEMGKSLFVCREYCKTITLQLLKNHKNPGIPVLIEKLQEELAYQEMLASFGKKFDEIYKTRFLELEFREDDVRKEKALLEAGRYDFVRETAEISMQLIKIVLHNHQQEKKLHKENFSKEPKEEIEPFQKDAFNYDEVKLQHYPEGRKKSESYFLHGRFNGPSRFWNREGELLAETWYEGGKREGRCVYYYPDGTLERVLYFKEGAFEGTQKYYYANGRRKAVIPYENGQLDGSVELYYETGGKKRILRFRKGKRDGKEEMWSRQGKILIDVEYCDGKPVGEAREWYLNGVLARELIYDEESCLLSMKQCNSKGELTKEEDADYFDTVTLKTDSLTASLEEVHKSFHNMAEVVSEEEKIDVTGDLAELEKEFRHLHELNQEMLKESGVLKHSGDEALWKTPSSQKELSDQLQEATEKLTGELEGVHDALKEVLGAIIKKADEEEKGL